MGALPESGTLLKLAESFVLSALTVPNPNGTLVPAGRAMATPLVLTAAHASQTLSFSTTNSRFFLLLK